MLICSSLALTLHLQSPMDLAKHCMATLSVRWVPTCCRILRNEDPYICDEILFWKKMNLLYLFKDKPTKSTECLGEQTLTWSLYSERHNRVSVRMDSECCAHAIFHLLRFQKHGLGAQLFSLALHPAVWSGYSGEEREI